MKTMQLEVPTGRAGSYEMTGSLTVEGEVRGPFLIHKTPCIYPRRGRWTVTHIPSKFSALQDIPSKKRAEWLAKQLIPIADWEFTDPRDVKKLPANTLAAIKVLRVDALHGDCQGTIP